MVFIILIMMLSLNLLYTCNYSDHKTLLFNPLHNCKPMHTATGYNISDFLLFL